MKSFFESEKAQVLGLLLLVYVYYTLSEIKPWEIEQIVADVKSIVKAVGSL